MMIELQGSLETEANAPLQDGQSLGRLDLSNPVQLICFSEILIQSQELMYCMCTQSKPTLRISHALLTGSIVTLQKPLAVLRHTLQPSLASQSDADSDSDSDSAEAPAKRVKFNNNTTTTTTDASSSPQDTFKKASARNFAPKTPLSKFQHKSEGHGAVDSSSPLAPSPATPASVSELRSGSHEIIGISVSLSPYHKRLRCRADGRGGQSAERLCSARDRCQWSRDQHRRAQV